MTLHTLPETLNDGTTTYTLVSQERDAGGGIKWAALYDSVPPDPEYQFTPGLAYLENQSSVPVMHRVIRGAPEPVASTRIALSLHVGLNAVDPAHYAGWSGDLVACEFDAGDMSRLAVARGFQTGMLLTQNATAANVLAAITHAATELRAGDIFFLTYSGHGSQVPDRNGDESELSGMDSTWCLYDRQVIDDELWNAWSQFRSGVRIAVLSDSCHSGSVTRLAPGPGVTRRARLMPPAIARKVYQDNQPLYDAIQRQIGTRPRTVDASVILISGCQDNQFSWDGDENGLFTGTLKTVWNDGAFQGNYRRFRDTIVQAMPSDQTPNYTLVGKPNPAFEEEEPFKV